MSSFPASSSAIPDYRRVRVAANLGALFDCSGVSYPLYNVPQNTLPFAFQQLDVATPLQLYQYPAQYLPTVPNTHMTTIPTANNLLYPNHQSPSLISSREATPSSTTSTTTTTPDVYSAIHSHAMNYFQTPMQHLDANEAVATQQMPRVTSGEGGNGEPAPPRKPRRAKKTNTVGPIRNSTSNQRPRQYTRPAASTSSGATTLGLGGQLSAKAMSRLAVQSVCKINGCGEIFASAEVYMVHVRDFHCIKQGKSGNIKTRCPLDGCGKLTTEGSLWNHVLGHSTKSGCRLCDTPIMGTRSDAIQKHYRSHHKETHAEVMIPSNTRALYAYLFFSEE